MTDEFQVGVITSTHGIRGEVKVFPTTDDPGRFKKLKTVRVNTHSGTALLHIKSVKFFKQFVILGFEEYSDINVVESLKKATLTIDRADAVPLEEDEYFITDLIGLRGVTDTGEDIGVLTDVLTTGANDVYIFEKEGTQRLIPAIRDCILKVDMESSSILLHLLEGL